MEDNLVQDLDGAIRIIDNCTGFSDESTAAGEAWLFVQGHVAELESENAALRAKLDETREAFNWWMEVSNGYDEYGWSFWISEDAEDELKETHTAAWEDVERLLAKGEE